MSRRNESFKESLICALRGIVYTLRTQRNFRIQILAAFVVLPLLAAIRPGPLEVGLVVFAIVLVLLAELFNTAIEAAVDLYVDEYHHLARIAKNVAAGAVLLACLNALITAGLVILSLILD